MGGSDKSLIECALGLLPNPIWPVESIFWLVLSRFLQILRAGGNLFPSRSFTIPTLTIPIATPPGEIPSLPPPGIQHRPGPSSSLCSKVRANAEMRQKKSVLHPFFFNLPLSLFLIFCVFGWVLSFGMWDLVPQPGELDWMSGVSHETSREVTFDTHSEGMEDFIHDCEMGEMIRWSTGTQQG